MAPRAVEMLVLDVLLVQLDRGHPQVEKFRAGQHIEQVIALAVIDSLGKIGTEKSRALLEKMGKQQGNIWMKKAADTLKRMEEHSLY